MRSGPQAPQADCRVGGGGGGGIEFAVNLRGKLTVGRLCEGVKSFRSVWLADPLITDARFRVVW